MNTIVIFTSDHGDYAGQFGWLTKGGMYEHSVRVPLIIHDPAYPDSHGKRASQIVNNLGLFQTVLDRCDIEHGPTSSRSLLPLLSDPESAEWLNRTYSEFKGRR